MIDTIFFWTGAGVWAAIISGLALLVIWLAALTFVSAWHVVRVFRHGWLRNPERSFARSLPYPFRMWAYFWLQGPRYIERNDGRGGRIYRPFMPAQPERFLG